MELYNFIAVLDKEQQTALKKLILCGDGFSVDWFQDMPASLLTGIVLKLHTYGWISHEGKSDLYLWTPEFPKPDFMKWIDQSQTSTGFSQTPDQFETCQVEKNNEKSASIYPEREKILALLDRAVEEDKSRKISAALADYDTLLDTLFNMHESKPLPENLQYTFIHVVEKRARLSLFKPRMRKMITYLSYAINMAESLRNQKMQASLDLLLGQHYWVALDIKRALSHWRRAWEVVEDLNDADLLKMSLKLKILSYVGKGQHFKAIEQYERLIGNIESFDEDFSLFNGMVLSFIYTDAGMPQRGLGICESIRKQCVKKENQPLLALSYAMAGANFLEIGQVKRGKIYFEKSLVIAQNEDISSVEFIAKVGLICVACLEGEREVASEIYSSIRHVPKSSWYYLLHYYALFETFYRLFGKDVLAADWGILLEDTPLDVIAPVVSQMIRRLKIILQEGDPAEKISKLKVLEEKIDQNGETFEIAKIRMEIARFYLEIRREDLAKGYASAAWKFIKPIAREAFPEDLLYLLAPDDLATGGSLSDLVVAMGNALVTQDNLKGLLTNIIASLSQMTGSERSAIFIKDSESEDIKMVASRNLFYENVMDEEFRTSFDTIQAMFRNGNSCISEFEFSDSELIDTRKAIFVPLMLKDRIVGVYYQDGRLFSLDSTPERNNILSALASQVALAIDRARAYDEIAKLNRRLIEENLYYIDEKEEFRPFKEIIGSSQGIKDVQRLVRKVAPTRSAALIQGETGVGKELIARAIHRESPRKNQAFIRVNCAALPDSLIDSELFGHEKGAFTGAVKAKAGRFELAHQGTIFLDEVSELPLPTQSRLLRVLQEKEFQRVGGTKILNSDFRLITATNKDLKKEVAAGRFREDLFYRLNVYPIVVPPLRERREDIPLLAAHFFRLFSSQSNKPCSGIKVSEMEQLKAYSWPGNIRELSNVIERAVISDAKHRFADLTASSRTKEPWDSADGSLNYKDFERKLIFEALRKCSGVVGGKGGAAELLGMKRTTLIHHMKKLGIKVQHQAI